MRNIFIAVSKVFGLIQIYYGLHFIGSIVFLVQALNFSINHEGSFQSTSSSGFVFGVLSIIWMFVLPLVLAWLLIFKAEWLADKLKIPEQTEAEGLSKETLLLTGVILAGLYFTVQAAPTFVSATLKSFQDLKVGEMSSFEFRNWIFDSFFRTVVAPALSLLFGLLLMFKASKVTALLTRHEKKTEPMDTKATSEEL